MNRVKAMESEVSVSKCIYPNGNTFFDVKFSSNGIVTEHYSFKLQEDGTTLAIANGSNETPDVTNRAVNAIRYSMENNLFN
ncbi:MAG TPA: hypothetical protein VN958_04785 [Chitinophagaceae bacterium]|nr:hypothetical protein [Chitinophagaceae bacterium]